MRGRKKKRREKKNKKIQKMKLKTGARRERNVNERK